MKKSIIILSTAAFLSSAFATLINWNTDAKNSSVSWEISDKKGTFSNLAATINFDKANLGEAKIKASVDVNTLKAGNEKLEKHLLSADFFDGTSFPKITFTSSNISATDKGYLAKGTLTMKDSTKTVELPFTFTENSNGSATFSGTMAVNAGEYGVIKNAKPGSDKVMIYLTIPVTK